MAARKRKKKWIQKLHLKKGALHRQLGIPVGERIPDSTLREAAKAGGKLSKRAQLALNLRKKKR